MKMNKTLMTSALAALFATSVFKGNGQTLTAPYQTNGEQQLITVENYPKPQMLIFLQHLAEPKEFDRLLKSSNTTTLNGFKQSGYDLFQIGNGMDFPVGYEDKMDEMLKTMQRENTALHVYYDAHGFVNRQGQHVSYNKNDPRSDARGLVPTISVLQPVLETAIDGGNPLKLNVNSCSSYMLMADIYKAHQDSLAKTGKGLPAGTEIFTNSLPQDVTFSVTHERVAKLMAQNPGHLMTMDDFYHNYNENIYNPVHNSFGGNMWGIAGGAYLRIGENGDDYAYCGRMSAEDRLGKGFTADEMNLMTRNFEHMHRDRKTCNNDVLFFAEGLKKADHYLKTYTSFEEFDFYEHMQIMAIESATYLNEKIPATNFVKRLETTNTQNLIKRIASTTPEVFMPGMMMP